MINKSPAHSPDPAWLAGRPAFVPLANNSACCLVVALSDAGLQHALVAGGADIRDMALEQVAPELDAGRSLIWRITGPSVPRLPAEIADIEAIDRLLGRADARDPLFIRTRRSADALNQAFHVPADFAWFHGHFPGDLILPGIAQLRLSIDSGRVLTGHARQPRAIHQLKFKSPVRPDQIVELTLHLIDGGATVLFSYRSSAGEHSSGRLVYGAP